MPEHMRCCAAKINPFTDPLPHSLEGGLCDGLLAKRWESALLVNVGNDTLSRLLASDEAMEALLPMILSAVPQSNPRTDNQTT